MGKKDEKGNKGRDKDDAAGQPPPAAAHPPAAESAPAAQEPVPAEASPTDPPPADAAPADSAPAPEAQEPVTGMTLEELNELGAVASVSQDGPFVDVLTKGGARLRFPGDEAKADALTDEELFGPDAADADPAAVQVADEAALRGALSPVDRALAHWGLEARHVLAAKEAKAEDGSLEVVVVTQGGQKLRFPKDAARVLSPMEKGDGEPQPQAAGVFPQAK